MEVVVDKHLRYLAVVALNVCMVWRRIVLIEVRVQYVTDYDGKTNRWEKVKQIVV
jgi:hypothetical protein